MQYCTFRSRALQMASHMPLTSKSKCIKNEQMCVSKNQKLQWEAQLCQVKNPFKAMHSDSRAKFVTCFLMSNSWTSLKKHCNLCLRWIMRSVKNQTFSKIWPKLPQRHIFKNHYKTLLILIIWGQDCSKCHETHIFKILWFFIKLSKMVRWAPKSPRGTIEWPPESKNVCKINEKSNIFQYLCQISAKTT